MPIVPLPVMLEDEKHRPAPPEPPKTLVVRYGYMRLIAELPCNLDSKPGCGTKLVIRTPRGIELGEMLTATCPNGGCGKALTRKQVLEYVEKSGGKNYPFTTQGRILRIATREDLTEQERLDARKPEYRRFTVALINELDLPMKLVDVEQLLGGERVIFHYTSDQWVDFRELVRRLASEFQTRIEMHQVNARDEARLVADYERCGQHCCCRQFLKVLKPVSMRSAKVQKQTLDPSKISGRCGRLMCCLRYEDQTYEQLRKNLPNRQRRVMTDDGPGTVIDTQILTQLVLVRLDNGPGPGAYPVENIRALTRDEDREIRAKAAAAAEAAAEAAARRALRQSRRRGTQGQGGQAPTAPAPAPQRPDKPARADRAAATGNTAAKGTEAASTATDTGAGAGADTTGAETPGTGTPKRTRRRRGRRGGKGRPAEGGQARSSDTPPEPSGPPAGGEQGATPPSSAPSAQPPAEDEPPTASGASGASGGSEASGGAEASGGQQGRRKRRRKRRRRGGDGGDGGRGSSSS